jgi:hypothetical protein
LTEFGELVPLPVDMARLPRRIGILTGDPPVVGEILWHMASIPSSELRDLLSGKISFQDALSSTEEGALLAGKAADVR